jgi:hypothetical protein
MFPTKKKRMWVLEMQNSVVVCLIDDFFIRFQVIAINNQFPGPLLNVTTNENVRVNVQNNLDEPLLITWYHFSLCSLYI